MMIPLNHYRRKALTAILLLLFLTVIVHATEVETFQVSPSKSMMYVFDLNSGRRVTGSFLVDRGNNDINFKVTDPVGDTIVDLGRVAGGISFEFTASRDGNYTVIFDNSFSISTSKTVTMSYDVGYTFLGIDLLNLLSVIATILIVIFVLAIALYLLSRKKTQRARAENL
jgi:cbb3-type cytochrome oxidase subunit 3